MAQYVMFYKPRGYLTACRDRHRPTIMELLPQELRRLHPVGRLDRDTEGLLLLTDDGTLDNRLLHPRLHVEKEYFFAAFGTLDDGKRQRLEQGLYLPGDPAITRPARLTDAAMTTLAQTAGWLPRVCNRRMLRLPDRPVATGVLTIREGRKHQVRRMLGAVDCQIFYLKRIGLGGVKLDPALQPGQYRCLTAEEKRLLRIDEDEPMPV